MCGWPVYYALSNEHHHGNSGHKVMSSPTMDLPLTFQMPVLLLCMCPHSPNSVKCLLWFWPLLVISGHWLLLPIFAPSTWTMGFPGGSVVKKLPANAGDAGSITGLARSPGGGSPLQYSCLENPRDTRAWQAIVHGVPKRVRHALAAKQQHAPSDHEPEERQKN